MKRRWLGLGTGALLWVASSYVLITLGVRLMSGTLDDMAFVGPLLSRGELFERAAPIGIVVVFSWVFVLVAVRAVRLIQEQGAVRTFAAARAGTTPELPAARRATRRAELHKRYAAAPARLADIVPGSAALDGTALDGGYAALRAYVWSMPVLGFIGTAWGMARAIGGFSDALKQATPTVGQPQVQDAIGLLTTRLAQTVIPGLSGAFSVTVVALAASVVAHFWVTALHAWDERALEELDRASIEKLADAVPTHATGGIPPSLASELSTRLAEVGRELHALSVKLDLGTAGSQLSRAAADHAQAARELKSAAEEVKSTLKAPYHITLRRGDAGGQS